MKRFLCAVITAFCLCGAAEAKPVVDAVALFNHPVSDVERITGKPFDTTRNAYEEIRDYHTSRGLLSVRFNGGRARAFLLQLKPTEKSFTRALSLLGVDVSRRKPDKSDIFRKVWQGKFANQLIKVVAATKLEPDTYGVVSVKDSDD